MSKKIDLMKIARHCHGYNASDISALCREAAVHILNETPNDQIYEKIGLYIVIN